MTDPRLLILETSGRCGQVAIAVGESILGRQALAEGRRHARDLAPTVAELLSRAGWKAKQLDAVFVSRGPGSYTGLRVGIMSAKTLAYSIACALIGIDTFAAIARQAPPECRRVDVLADAQKQNVYVQSFEGGGQHWQPVTELLIRPFADWLADRPPDTWVTGPGLIKWSSHLPPDVPVVPASAWDPQIESLLAIGLQRYRADERDDPLATEPLYLRPSSAEEQWSRP